MKPIAARPAALDHPKTSSRWSAPRRQRRANHSPLLERRLTWLATIGAVAPFVGLFGTVMGIVDAFHGLGTEGAATLRAVAPGVSEALITTAAGLLVAIPAVIAYNQFTASLREFASRMDDFSRELLNSLEEISQQPNQEPMEREAASGLHR